jgi:anti-sigma factor RsiW
MPPPITCRELIDFLDDYVEERLGASVRATFEAHLAACRHCREYLRTYRDTIRLAQSACAETGDGIPASMPGDIVRAVLAAKGRGHAPPRTGAAD